MAAAEEKAKLVAMAKELGIKGILTNMSVSTLKNKIAEVTPETSADINESKPSELRKFAKFKKGF